jgi:hypothetical protein
VSSRRTLRPSPDGMRKPAGGDCHRAGVLPWTCATTGKRLARPTRSGSCSTPARGFGPRCPCGFNLDWPLIAKPGEQAQPAVRSWLVTSGRAGRSTGR